MDWKSSLSWTAALSSSLTSSISCWEEEALLGEASAVITSFSLVEGSSRISAQCSLIAHRLIRTQTRTPYKVARKCCSSVAPVLLDFASHDIH